MITFSVPSFLMGICYVFMGFSQQVPLSSPALFFVIPGSDRGSQNLCVISSDIIDTKVPAAT